MLSKISQAEEDKYHMISLICGILKKEKIRTNITKQKQTHRYREQTDGCQRRGGGEWAKYKMYKFVEIFWM